MRIGIVTIHYNYTNLGCTLQAYTLARHLKRYAESVKIVDHRYPGKLIAIGAPHTPSYLTQFRFIERNLPRSQTFLMDDHRATEAHMREKYDLLVYGSDEIWKWKINEDNTQKYASYITPVPNIFWPLGLDIPKISYAACIGRSDTVLPPRLRDRLRDSLNEFDAISVRDTRSAGFVNETSGRTADIVPDPVYLEDLSDECDPDLIARKLRGAGAKPNIPIVGYYLHGAPKPAPMKGAQLIDLKRCQLTPVEFWYVPKLLDLVITNTHHGALVALIQNTPCHIARPCPPKVKDHAILYNLQKDLTDLDTIKKNWNPEFIDSIVKQQRKIGIDWIKHTIEKLKIAPAPNR